jgi:ABC-type tungstate transport system permease subunit
MIASKPLIGLPMMLRRGLVLAVAALTCLILLPAGAQADSSTSLTAIGTSDVSDSGLIQNVIQPQFHAAYPQFTFKYVGTASGTAITDAETGVNAPSVLIVHAASLENTFVSGGYSYEPYGRAVWTNDFVLAGPTADPAGVLANGTSNAAQAFADIAQAGINGGGTPLVTFVSRGGTPGTTVEEHQIWALVKSSGLAPTGLQLCTVPSSSPNDGGGMTPVTAASGMGGGPCTTTVGGTTAGLPPAGALPAWYVTNTTLTQGPNVVNANACTGYASPANSCYVFTDRGTFDFLASGLDPAGTIPNLEVVTHGPQPASAPGGVDLLINYFHAYVINPAGCAACGVNLTAAEDFVNLITSPAVQSQLKYYLDDTSDAAGAPFVADASPDITVTGFPTTTIANGMAVTVTGSVTNAEPGYPVLSGKTVAVDQVVAGVDVPVAGATGTTDGTGTYNITFVPPASGTYQVTTAQISQVENPNLNPVFGDLLSPGASPTSQLPVAPAPTPKPTVTKPTTVGIKHVSAKKGHVTVIGTLTPAPTSPGATVKLLAVKVTGSDGLKQVGEASVRKGKTGFMIKAKLKRGDRYVLQLEYSQKGQPTVYSKLGSINVH